MITLNVNAIKMRYIQNDKDSAQIGPNKILFMGLRLPYRH